MRQNAGVAFSIESISIGGVRLAGPLTFDVGEHIQILFELDGKPVELEGEIVRVDRTEMMTDRVAVAFRNVSVQARVAIHELVTRALDADGE